MGTSERNLRVVGVSVPDVSDWRDPLPAGKWSQFFRAIAEQVTLVDTVSAKPSRRGELFNLARHFHPRRTYWFPRAGLNPPHAARRAAAVKHALARRGQDYDLVVQLQTLCAPAAYTDRPYTIYTDNTFALTRRFYPEWAPLSPRAARDWREFEARVCREAAAVFTFSEFARGSVIADYGCPPERTFAIGAGANQLLTSLAGKRYEQPIALFVGRPFELKGGPTLLSAWSIVRSRLPSAELVIVGPRGAPPRHLAAGATWLGRVDRARLAALYAQAAVFVLPTMYDAWGHVFVEAMGHGLPCIGTNCCAVPELIEDGVTGRLVPRGEAEPLADALCDLLQDPAKCRAMGAIAHARVLERLTWGHVAERFVDRVADALAARQR